MTSVFRVDIVTKDHGLLSAEVTGLTGPVQAARMIVTCGADSRSHVVVWAAASSMQLPMDDERVRKLFPVDFVSCIRSDQPGATTLSCPAGDKTTMFAAAAAAATIKRSWGWDESPTILVQLASVDLSITLNPVFQDGAWTVNSDGGA